jgi:nucleoside-diphosphate-sugar epimerase
LLKPISERYGLSNLILLSNTEKSENFEGEQYQFPIEIHKKKYLEDIVKNRQINHILNFLELDIFDCESRMLQALDLNINLVQYSMDIAHKYKCMLFIPSSLYIYGSGDNKQIKEDSKLNPISYYGISKIFMEKLGTHYHKKFNLDFRSLRIPFLINTIKNENLTEFTTEIFQKGSQMKPYNVYLNPSSQLCCLYESDYIRCFFEFIETSNSSLTQRVYNINGVRFKVIDYVKEAQKILKSISPEFDEKDLRSQLPLYFPSNIDDSLARKDWGWAAKINSLELLITTLIQDNAEVENRKYQAKEELDRYK